MHASTTGETKNSMLHGDAIRIFLPRQKCATYILLAVLKEKDILKPSIVRIEFLPEEGSLFLLGKNNLRIDAADIIFEYLDDRFPYPPLYPPDPLKIAQISYEFIMLWEYIILFDKNLLTLQHLVSLSDSLAKLLEISTTNFITGDTCQLLDYILGILYKESIRKGIPLRITNVKLASYLRNILNYPTIRNVINLASQLDV